MRTLLRRQLLIHNYMYSDVVDHCIHDCNRFQNIVEINRTIQSEILNKARKVVKLHLYIIIIIIIARSLSSVQYRARTTQQITHLSVG